MGYCTKVNGRLIVTNKVSEKFLIWLMAFCKTRHSLRDANEIMKKDSEWAQKTPYGELDKDCVLYSPGEEESMCRGFIINNNKYPDSIPDFYFPYSVSITSDGGKSLSSLKKERRLAAKRGTTIPLGEEPVFSIELVPNGCDKPYGWKEWLEWLCNSELMKTLGSVYGAFLAVGEEFGDATYAIVSENIVTTYDAYSDSANDVVESYLKSVNDKIVLSDFKKIKTTPMQLECEWDEDDYDDD